jgi:hypothetical protein
MLLLLNVFILCLWDHDSNQVGALSSQSTLSLKKPWILSSTLQPNDAFSGCVYDSFPTLDSSLNNTRLSVSSGDTALVGGFNYTALTGFPSDDSNSGSIGSSFNLFTDSALEGEKFNDAALVGGFNYTALTGFPSDDSNSGSIGSSFNLFTDSALEREKFNDTAVLDKEEFKDSVNYTALTGFLSDEVGFMDLFNYTELTGVSSDDTVAALTGSCFHETLLEADVHNNFSTVISDELCNSRALTGVSIDFCAANTIPNFLRLSEAMPTVDYSVMLMQYFIATVPITHGK